MSECKHTDEEIRELAYLVWLKDQTKTVEQALSPEILEASTTLTDIADAWNYDDIGQGRYVFRQQWPELADLLDALEGTDNE